MANLPGKTALVTGGSSGIGREVVLELAAQGAAVMAVGRSREKGEAVVRAARAAGAAQPVTFVGADLAEMREVRRVAALVQHERLDFLVHSAGVHHMRRSLTSDSVEVNFAVNYLNKFLLTNLLLDKLNGGGRVVVVGSPYVFDPKVCLRLRGLSGGRLSPPTWALVKSGMAVSVWAVELARRLAGTGTTVNTVVPGVVRTDILRNDPPVVRLMDRLIQHFGQHQEPDVRFGSWLSVCSDCPSESPVR